MNTSLEGKSVVITGGASGIGAKTCEMAAAAGAMVTIADLDKQKGDALAQAIKQSGGRAQFVRTDISDEEQVKAMVAAAVSSFGRIDAAFNNAGLSGYSHQGKNTQVPFAEIPVEGFQRVIDVNLLGTFLCMKYEILEMLKTGGGSIVNTSSCAGILAIGGAPDYVAAKHGVIGLTKAGALDYATQNIRVNAILPGIILTPMMETSFAANPQMKQWAAEAQPNKRLGKPEEIAAAALWLMSDAASLVTGISMPVDGGYSMV